MPNTRYATQMNGGRPNSVGQTFKQTRQRRSHFYNQYISGFAAQARNAKLLTVVEIIQMNERSCFVGFHILRFVFPSSGDLSSHCCRAGCCPCFVVGCKGGQPCCISGQVTASLDPRRAWKRVLSCSALWISAAQVLISILVRLRKR